MSGREAPRAVGANRQLKNHASPAVLPYRKSEIYFFPDCLRGALYTLFMLELSGRQRPAMLCARPGCGRCGSGTSSRYPHSDRSPDHPKTILKAAGTQPPSRHPTTSTTRSPNCGTPLTGTGVHQLMRARCLFPTRSSDGLNPTGRFTKLAMPLAYHRYSGQPQPCPPAGHQGKCSSDQCRRCCSTISVSL